MASALNRTPQQFLDEFAEAKWQELSMEQLKSFCKARNLLHTEIKGKSKADLQDSVQKFLDICAGNLRLFSPKTPAPPAEDSGEHRANSPEVTQLFPAPKASPPDEPHPPVSSEPDALPAKVHPLFTTIQRRHTATILHAWGDYTNQAESVPQWAERLIESLTENKLSVDHRLDGLERHYHALSEGYYTHLDEERRQFAELHAELVKDHYETQMDLTSLRREIQTAERATRSERVTAAGQALLPDTALDPDADAKALLRKTIGRSPVLRTHNSQEQGNIRNCPNIQCIRKMKKWRMRACNQECDLGTLGLELGAEGGVKFPSKFNTLRREAFQDMHQAAHSGVSS